MVLRAEYRLGHSPFNKFLFAYIGEESTGLSLTVLSALSRLGLDPWAEAARLSEMPEETATTSLAATISKLPEGDWDASDTRSIAVRLLSNLPKHSITSDSSQRNPATGRWSLKPGVLNVLAWIAVAATLVAIFWRPDD